MSTKVFNTYTNKEKPEDADLALVWDSAASKVKSSKFSGIMNYIIDKLATAVTAKLQTSNKTVIGAINELNSNCLNNLAPWVSLKNSVTGDITVGTNTRWSWTNTLSGNYTYTLLVYKDNSISSKYELVTKKNITGVDWKANDKGIKHFDLCVYKDNKYVGSVTTDVNVV